MNKYLKKDDALLKQSYTHQPLCYTMFNRNEHKLFGKAFPIKICVDQGPNSYPKPYYFKSIEVAEGFAYALRIESIRYDQYDFSYSNEDTKKNGHPNLSKYPIK